MAELRANLGGFDTTANSIETSGMAVVKELQAIRDKIVVGSKSFFIANRGDALRNKADGVFTEATAQVEKFYKSLAEGVRTEKQNVANVDMV
jgi:hypothetical protein